MSASTAELSTTNTTRHHCYLLQSLSSPNKTYIGYTVNPFRRLKQHNGLIKGGANYTSKFRPWKFIAITEGFESEVKGLQFEWAWQHPKRSKIFRNGLVGNSNNSCGSGMALAGMLEKQRGYLGRLRILMILLCQSAEFRDTELNVYFFEDEKLAQFNGLFNANRFDEDDEDNEENFCKALPAHMGAFFVESVEDMPFYRHLIANRRRPKKRGEDANGCDPDDDDEEDSVNVEMDVEEKTDGNICLFDENDANDGVQDISICQIQIQRLSIDPKETGDDFSDSSVDLLESSDEENVKKERFRGQTGHRFDMDLCSPLRPLNESQPCIDLVSPSSTNEAAVTHFDFEVLIEVDDLRSCSSDETIDLCSPQKENVRI